MTPDIMSSPLQQLLSTLHLTNCKQRADLRQKVVH